MEAAVEGFRECYPPEHPKRIAAEQRLERTPGGMNLAFKLRMMKKITINPIDILG